MSTEKIWSREETPGAREQLHPQRKFLLLAKDFSSTEQAVPVRLVFGTAKVAGTYITPIFGFRSEPIQQTSGK